MELVLKALQFAQEKHAGQTRKVSKLPYVTHTIAVSYIVAAFKRSKKLEYLLVASILHDVLEDTDATFEELAGKFGPLVASLVFELTNDEDEIDRVGKLVYHKKKLVGLSSWALVIKLADRLSNVMDNPSEKMVRETLELMTHLSCKRKLSGTHRKLVAEIVRVCEEFLTKLPKA